jgi:hypothetical protein
MKISSFIWRKRGKPAELNPEVLFGAYENAIADIESGRATGEDTKLLAQAWKIFDNEGGRRTTIDTRASMLMPAISVAVTLVTGIGFTVLKDNTISMDARVAILITLVLALFYLLRTMLLLFVIHGKVYRNTLDPSDIVLPIIFSRSSVSLYDRKIACKLLRYTLANYRVNNIQSDNLFVAQHSFRNAILIVAIGGTIAACLLFLKSLNSGNPDDLKPQLRLVCGPSGSSSLSASAPSWTRCTEHQVTFCLGLRVNPTGLV